MDDKDVWVPVPPGGADPIRVVRKPRAATVSALIVCTLAASWLLIAMLLSHFRTTPSDATIPLKFDPSQIVVSRDGGRAFVSSDSEGTISVVDLPERRVVADVSMAGQVSDMALSPDGHWLYVANYADSVQVMDTRNDVVSTLVNLPGSVETVTLNATGSEAYVTFAGMTTSILATVVVASGSILHEMEVPSDSAIAALTPDGRFLDVSTEPGTYVSASGSQMSDNGMRFVVDTVSHRVVAKVNSPSQAVCDMAMSRDGAIVYRSYCAWVGHSKRPLSIEVASSATAALRATIPVPLGVLGLVVSPDGRTLYAATTMFTIDKVDTRTNTIVGTVPIAASDGPGESFGPLASNSNGTILCVGTTGFGHPEMLVVPIARS